MNVLKCHGSSDLDKLNDEVILAIQDGLRRGNRIPSANQDLQVEVHIPGWKDHPNGQKCGDEAF